VVFVRALEVAAVRDAIFRTVVHDKDSPRLHSRFSSRDGTTCYGKTTALNQKSNIVPTAF
jgi:hypothetical protein